jgi:cholinesterase
MGSCQNESALFGKIISGMSLGFGPKDNAGAVNMENDFRCGTAEGAKGRVMNKVPAWRYLFANNKPGSSQGATHGDEVPYVFGDGKSGLSKYVQGVWAAFAENPTDGLSKLGWPKYDPNGMCPRNETDSLTRSPGKTLVRIAPDQKVGVDFVQPTMYDGTCPPSRV